MDYFPNCVFTEKVKLKYISIYDAPPENSCTKTAVCHLLLRDGEGLIEDRPDDGFVAEGRGERPPVAVEELQVSGQEGDEGVKALGEHR